MTLKWVKAPSKKFTNEGISYWPGSERMTINIQTARGVLCLWSRTHVASISKIEMIKHTLIMTHAYSHTEICSKPLPGCVSRARCWEANSTDSLSEGVRWHLPSSSSGMPDKTKAHMKHDWKSSWSTKKYVQTWHAKAHWNWHCVQDLLAVDDAVVGENVNYAQSGKQKHFRNVLHCRLVENKVQILAFSFVLHRHC